MSMHIEIGARRNGKTMRGLLWVLEMTRSRYCHATILSPDFSMMAYTSSTLVSMIPSDRRFTRRVGQIEFQNGSVIEMDCKSMYVQRKSRGMKSTCVFMDEFWYGNMESFNFSNMTDVYMCGSFVDLSVARKLNGDKIEIDTTVDRFFRNRSPILKGEEFLQLANQMESSHFHPERNLSFNVNRVHSCCSRCNHGGCMCYDGKIHASGDFCPNFTELLVEELNR